MSVVPTQNIESISASPSTSAESDPQENHSYWESLFSASQTLISSQNFLNFAQWVGQEILEKLDCIRVQIQPQDTVENYQLSQTVDVCASWVVPESIQASRYPCQTISLIENDHIWGNLTVFFFPDSHSTSQTSQYLQQMGVQLTLAYQREQREQQHIQEKARQELLNQQLIQVNQQLQDNRVLSQQCSLENHQLSDQLSQLQKVRLELERQNRRSSIISGLNRKILQSPEIEEVLNTITHETRKFLQADRVLIYQVISHGGGKITHESLNPKFSSTLGLHFPEESFPVDCQERLATRPYHAVQNARLAYPEHPCMVNFMDHWEIQSKVLVPITLQKQVWGFLIVHQCEDEHHWSSIELELLSNIRDLLELSLNQTQLHARIHQELRLKKRTEIQLHKALEAKDNLLGETHRRVKSNLNIISSILNLQAGYSKEEAVVNVLHDSQLRIHCIALIYEQLNQCPENQKVQMSPYVGRLIQQMRDLIGSDGDLITVDLQISNEMQLDLEVALPCSLIINELLTNSFKYAFPTRKSGQIKISLQVVKNSYQLSVQDNGVGIPKKAWEQSSALGLRLAKLLAQQLNSELLLLPTTQGSHFQILFSSQ